MSSHNSIAVIGAGPSGLYTATLLKEYAKANRQSLSVDIYERSEKTKRHPVCTGLFTKEIEQFFSQPISTYDFYVNTLHHASIRTQKDNVTKELVVPTYEYLVNRRRFDEHFANDATAAGCSLYYGHTVTGITTKGTSSEPTLLIKAKNKIVTKAYRFVVVATGSSQIPLDKKDTSVYPHLIGAQYHITTSPAIQKTDTFSCFFDKSNPDFFYWIVPEDAHHLRIGTAAQKNTREKLDAFLTKYIKSSSITAKRKRFEASIIPFYSAKRRRNLHRHRVKGLYYCGDCAHAIKDTTGGGVIPGLLDAETTALHIINKIQPKQKRKLRSLLRSWKLTRELSIHQLIMRLFKKKNFFPVTQLSETLSHSSIKKIIKTTSRDRISLLILRLLIRKPTLPFKIIRASLSHTKQKKAKTKERFI